MKMMRWNLTEPIKYSVQNVNTTITTVPSNGRTRKENMKDKTKDKIDYEYSMETTKLIADWIASCPVNFVNVVVPENDEVQLTLSRTRNKRAGSIPPALKQQARKI